MSLASLRISFLSEELVYLIFLFIVKLYHECPTLVDIAAR